MDTERRKVYPPSINMSLNKRCWNMFMISRMIWERRFDGRERETPEFSQTSFLRIVNSDAEFGFKFDKWSHVFNVPFNKTLFLEFVSKKIRTGSLFVRTVSRFSNQTTFIINMGELGRIGRWNSLSPIIPPVHHSKDGLFWILSRKDIWRPINSPISKWLN